MPKATGVVKGKVGPKQPWKPPASPPRLADGRRPVGRLRAALTIGTHPPLRDSKHLVPAYDHWGSPTEDPEDGSDEDEIDDDDDDNADDYADGDGKRAENHEIATTPEDRGARRSSRQKNRAARRRVLEVEEEQGAAEEPEVDEEALVANPILTDQGKSAATARGISEEAELERTGEEFGHKAQGGTSEGGLDLNEPLRWIHADRLMLP